MGGAARARAAEDEEAEEERAAMAEREERGSGDRVVADAGGGCLRGRWENVELLQVDGAGGPVRLYRRFSHCIAPLFPFLPLALAARTEAGLISRR